MGGRSSEDVILGHCMHETQYCKSQGPPFFKTFNKINLRTILIIVKKIYTKRLNSSME